MQLHYLEIVSHDIDAVCAAYARTHDAKFGEPDARLGNAKTADLTGGWRIGVRAPMHESEDPVVRPYWRVSDIEASLKEVVACGGEIAHPAMELPELGTFAIYIQGGNHHGLWQV